MKQWVIVGLGAYSETEEYRECIHCENKKKKKKSVIQLIMEFVFILLFLRIRSVCLSLHYDIMSIFVMQLGSPSSVYFISVLSALGAVSQPIS